MPVGTTYLASSAGTFDQYGNSYVNFTVNLITSTFEALLQAHHSQVEAYAELVGTLSQGLTTYINETNNDIQISEILDFITNLPLEQAGLLEVGQQLTHNGDDTNSDPVLGVAPIDNASATPVSFATQIQEIVSPNNSDSAIVQILNGIKEVLFKPEGQDDNIMGNPYQKLTDAITANNNQGIESAFLDIVRTVLSYNKYGMLQQMVETGLLRMVIDKGLIRTDFNMEFTESYSDEASSKQRNRYRTVTKDRVLPSPGLARNLFQRKYHQMRVAKQKVLTVTKRKNSQSNDTSGTVQMGALVEIHFSTDYKPLLLDNT